MASNEGPARTRNELLDEGAVHTGRSWAVAVRDDLQREGRRAAGGWPGTMREARGRATSSLSNLLRAQAMLALSRVELEHATSVVYRAARRAWLDAHEGRADDDEEEAV